MPDRTDKKAVGVFVRHIYLFFVDGGVSTSRGGIRERAPDEIVRLAFDL